ncbi:MAG: hypothetical protein K8V42_01985 [Enterococcus aquimarinus]|uniref:Uncharacterized protein n=1 Tax=Enterococcus aquimarinus TaxID=328396 RepID=A0A9E4DR04_9ENTE|nr:hypothetical protein [Enterococcus aquimarinus]
MMILVSFLSLTIAWLLPIVAMFFQKKFFYYSFFSMLACALGIWLEYGYIGILVQKEDWSAMMDIIPTMYTLLGLALLGTVVLNSILWWRVKSKESQTI